MTHFITDKTDLQNWMFLNQPEKIMEYIDHNFMSYAYDDILAFITDLTICVVSENISEGVGSHWNNDPKECYRVLKAYYTYEKRINEDRLKKRQNTEGSLIIMD